MPWSKIWEERFVGQIGGGGLDRTLSILMHQNAGGLLAIFPICHLTQYLTSSAPIPSLVRIIIISWTGTYGASPDMQKHRNHDLFFLNTPLTPLMRCPARFKFHNCIEIGILLTNQTVWLHKSKQQNKPDNFKHFRELYRGGHVKR